MCSLHISVWSLKATFQLYLHMCFSCWYFPSWLMGPLFVYKVTWVRNQRHPLFALLWFPPLVSCFLDMTGFVPSLASPIPQPHRKERSQGIITWKIKWILHFSRQFSITKLKVKLSDQVGGELWKPMLHFPVEKVHPGTSSCLPALRPWVLLLLWSYEHWLKTSHLVAVTCLAFLPGTWIFILIWCVFHGQFSSSCKSYF